MPDKKPTVSFVGSLYRSAQDKEGEVTLTLKVPASHAVLVTQAFELLRERSLTVSLTPEEA